METPFKFKAVLLTCGLSLLPYLSSANQTWQPHHFASDSVDEQSVLVWTKTVDGSDFKAFKGEVLINATRDNIVSVIRDTKNVPKWYYKSAYVKKLEDIADNQSLTYSVTDLPWPVSDRDSVILATVTNEQNGDITIIMTAKPNAYPIQENKVRVTKLDGFWKLQKQANNQVKVTLQLTTEPGGKIPSWLANTMVIDMPLNSLGNLKKRAETLAQ